MELKNIEELQIRVNALNDRTEEINKALVEFKQILKNISPGVQVWVDIDEKKTLAIGYTRIVNEWDLALKYKREDDDLIIPVMSSRRDQRLLYYKRMQKVVDALLETTKSMTNRMDRALKNEQDDEEED